MSHTAKPTEFSQDQVLTLLRQARTRIEELQQSGNEPIAVIGFAGRFPGANDAEAFWGLLKDGRSGLRVVTEDELADAGVPKAQQDDENYIRVWGGFDKAAGFDAGFFGYSPREAELLDPQQRAFLECAWAAMEDAGYDSARVPGPVGVYAGAALNGYLTNIAGAGGAVDPFQAAMGNLNGMVSARSSFHLDLKGPSIGVQTTCSTGLVAVHHAMRGLRQGECDMALAGAVAVNQARPAGYMYQSEGIASPDGVCRPFDAQAQGTIFTNGVGALVLKRLSRAQADGDTIHGLILGSAVNNDGADKISLTAPSVAGQADVLAAALKAANVDPASIDYVEAHGTATALGDPIEITALTRAYGDSLSEANRKAAISSVKGNLGHLDAAAGIAGLIRVLLSLRHGQLTPTANYSAPNPKCGFENTPFEVLAEARDWPSDPSRPRRAAISAFGIGGTNAHMILQEPPAVETPAAEQKTHVLPLSAQSPGALAELREKLADHLDRTGANLADVAHTLQQGRKPLAHREVVIGASALRSGGETGSPMEGTPTVAFVFSGQGTQHPDMARDLYANEPVFRTAFDECLDLVPDDLGLRELLLGSGVDAAALNRTELTQPALFVTEYALAQLWLARGVQPKVLLGHSIGEYVAACVAGVFSLADALCVVCARGRLMQACEPGAMLSVMMSQTEASGALPVGVEIAAVNAPRSVVLAGPTEVIERTAAQFDRSAIGCKLLKTSHAFHTSMMDPALAEFEQVLRDVTLNAPQIEMLSNVTGDWMTAAQATDPAYWVSQLRQAVLYGPCVAKVLELPNPLLLEVGPGSALIRLARQQMSETARVVASLPDAGAKIDGAEFTLKAMGSLWIAGADLDWSALHNAPRRRISLPTYPFQRESYWIAPAAPGSAALPAPGDDISDWFNQPVWTRAPQKSLNVAPVKVLVFGEALQEAPDGVEIIRVVAGDVYEAGESEHRLNPKASIDYAALFADLFAREWTPDHIVNGFGLREELAPDQPSLLFESTVALAQALQPLDLRPELTLLGLGMQRVTGAEMLSPGAAMALGLVPVLPQELAGLTCRALDADGQKGLGAALLSDWGEDVTCAALRAGYLWTQSHAPTRLDTGSNSKLLKPFATYLVTGDLLEGLGAIYAKRLAETLKTKLVLVGTGLPLPAEWDSWTAIHGPDHPVSQLIATLRELGEEGRHYQIYSGDQGDAAWLSRCLEDAEATLGKIHGVFHTAAMGDTYHCVLEDADGEANRKLFQTKLSGLSALKQALAGRDPKFCLLQSSLSVQVGGLGLATYAAANSFLNAFAEQANADGDTFWQAVEWDVCETASLGQVERDMLGAHLIRPDQLWTATQALLGHPQITRLAVTPANLQARIQAARNLHAKIVAPVAQPQERKLDTPFVAPRDEYEQAVADAMAELLGIKQIGAQDNFFELGGHSLLAIQIITRLRKTYDVELPIRALLYETPTVEGIASVIRKAREEAEQETDLLASLLDEIEDQPTETAD